ncbi:hypothetical protein PACTADRAFT_54098, partial [Pachysolen tannophilus NRRL Y-2460]
MIGESRTDLLNWLNSTLDLKYTKIEQCGSGAAYCQIFDSIFQDMPMSKVKFNSNSEYTHASNFKILQSGFVKHKIERNIPVDKLVRCRFQDNLEFLQWMKKFWMENKDETFYDPNIRRNSNVVMKSKSPSSSDGAAKKRVSSIGINSTLSSSSLPSSASLSSSSATTTQAQFQHQINNLTNELNHTKDILDGVNSELEEYKIAGEGLETERNFYFNKLREIEILTQSIKELLASNPEDQENKIQDQQITINSLISSVESILYSTEEGFQ